MRNGVRCSRNAQRRAAIARSARRIAGRTRRRPGRAVDFTGTVARGPSTGPTTLVRFTILCCRADAEPLALELDRRLDARTGAWINVRGVAIERNARAVLRVEHAHAVAAPPDPFLYL